MVISIYLLLSPSHFSLTQINAVEFMQMWNGIKSGKSSEYAEILRQIEPTKLPECKSKLQISFLGTGLKTTRVNFGLNG